MERLQKILASAGYGSRRSCEALIIEGRVRVNDQIARIGTKVDPARDHISVDDQKIEIPHTYQYIAIYKPRGILSAVSSSDKRYGTIREMVDIPGRLFPVGRLDLDSEGLMLLTDDGELANRLTHPRYKHEKEYRVYISRKPDEKQLNTWRRGLVLSDGSRTLPAQVFLDKVTNNGSWLRIILLEGRKRQIRETGMLLGLPVVRIIRTRISSLHLGSLKPGQWRYLNPQEINRLKG